MKTDPKLLSHYLSHHQVLHSFLHKAKKITAINKLLPQIFPTETLEHCQVMNISDENALIIGVDSAVWATRLRFIEQILLEKLHAHKDGKEIKTIQYRVRGANKLHEAKCHEASLPVCSPIPLTEKSHQIIYDLSSSISSPELKAVLLRLLDR